MKKITILLISIYIFLSPKISAQELPIKPQLIGHGVFLGETPPLRDLPSITPEEIAFMKEKAFKKAANKKLTPREYPYAATALPKGEDAAWQKTMGKTSINKAPLVNFEGQTTSSFPPDCNGTIGPNHYMQTVNTTYAIYNRSGTLLAGPTNMNLLFNGVSGANCNDGDPLIQYDEQAQRWIAVEFSLCGSNDLMLIAVSSSSDPTGTWYAYSFDVADTPDYEKLGVWQDGYYMGTNTGSGNDIYVFERSKMLIGAANPQMVAFDNPWRPGSGFLCVPPLDNDGTSSPAGTPGMFIAFNDDAVAGGSDQLWIYELAVNWTTPSSSTFNRIQQIGVTAFDSQFTASWDDITQPGSMKLDGVPQVIMNAPQYRNFGTYQTIVCCHTVDVNGSNQAGIRWYELRKTPPSSAWTVRQQGTYAPDASSRWMGSIMLNGSGKIGLAYSIASSSIYPGIRFCGQSAAAYANASGIMDIPEDIIQNGTVSQTSYNRWGDYALLSVDPNDDNTFWFSSEYVKSGGTLKGTKIASFRFGNNPLVSSLAATAVTAVSATLNGTVNPNGVATTYYFQWGTSVSYGNTTTTVSAGSGSSNIAVSAAITGLIGGTTYHFRLVASNADGSSYGSDLTFTPGAATVTTSAVSSVTLTTANCGGNIITDGGSVVTARGVCWSTTANPTTANNKTVDGTGIGSFTSSLTGLSANTIYHVRAYATNSNGTVYGGDSTFSTLCGIYTLPFSETFSSNTIPACWSQKDNQGNGQIWLFGTITGQSPNPLLTGNFAFLNSDSLGSGNSQNADLISPTLNLSTYNNVTLQFSHYFKSYSGSSGNLYYSIDNGSTWTLISAFTTTSASNPTVFSQIISAVSGQAMVKFKWNYTGTYGYYWAIDNISITGTSVSAAVLTTAAVSSVTYNSAVCGGNITSAGSSSVTARGVCWGTSSNPTISGSFTTDGSGIGNYTSNIGSLMPLTTYYVRAYATNTSGTSYGNEVSFTTLSNLPTLSTAAISAINNNSAVSGGNITSAGSSAVIARGVCWSTSANPVVSDNHTTDGNGIGSFISNISGLTTNTLYHVRAYATNGSGTSYGDDLIFNTSCGSISIFPWSEGFENAGNIPNCWSQEQVNNSGLNWVFGAGNGGSNPATAHTGSYNARLKDASSADNKTKLITPSLNLLSIINPKLYFWHTQQFWSPDQDTLIVFYKTSLSGTWNQLIKYSASITSWKLDSIILPSPSSDYYIAFEGNAKYGYGICIDDVSVNGTGCILPSVAGTINGLSSVCQGQSNVSYTVAAISNATSYSWTLPTGATGNSTSNSITINYGNSAVSGNITVKGINSCGEGISSSLAVTVNPLPSVAGTINGLTSVCQGQSNVSYTVAAIANATSYSWTLPTGATGNSTSNSITINYGNSAVSGNITVKGINSCGEGISSSLAVTVNPLPSVAGTINGLSSVCQGQSNVSYTVAAIANATSYSWTLPTGATGNSTSNSITINYGNSAVSGNITVKGINSCGEGISSSLAVTVNPLPSVAGTINGLTSVCQGQSNVSYTVAAIANATSYSWTLPTGATGNSTSNSITINYGNSAVSGNITVKGINSCGEGISSSLAVTVNPLPSVAGTINGLSSVCQGQSNLSYTVAAIANATSYSWTLPTGATGNSISNSITINYGNSAVSGNITVKGINSCGEGISDSLAVFVNTIPNSIGLITGPDTVNQGQNNVVYTVSTIPNSTDYIWTLPLNTTGNSISNSILLHFSDSSMSGNITVKANNECGSGEPSNKYVSVFKQLKVKLYLQGLYSQSNYNMNKVNDENGNHFPNDISDTVGIVLYHILTPFPIITSFREVPVLTNGWCIFKSPSQYKNPAYIAVYHRNHLETWSATPVSFAADTVVYDFTTSASQAYGDNQKQVAPGKFAVFTGDVNQDGVVDLSDLVDMDNDLTNGNCGLYCLRPEWGWGSGSF